MQYSLNSQLCLELAKKPVEKNIVLYKDTGLRRIITILSSLHKLIVKFSFCLVFISAENLLLSNTKNSV